MKKLFIAVACVFSCSTLMNAQDDCMAFFPSTEGAVLVNKTYDANKNLISTMTYRINESYDYSFDKDMEIGFTLTNGLNQVVDQGTLEANCNNGNFYMKMSNRMMAPEAVDLLVDNTELVSNFLDYPDTFRDDFLYDLSPFEMDGGEFSIRDKTAKKDLARVRVFNRSYEQTEKITTPAGTFDAAKVTFSFDVHKDGVDKTYRGIEWYAVGAGIVRSETYDENDVLQNYTELTSLEGVN